ncbi:hypothetical protein HUJ05_006633 [Dendroctonus ponderosae]|nr:hypothetical protein HUJ05_006633 [Dendroctonus ponderosae]
MGLTHGSPRKQLADEKKDGYIRYINNRSSEEDRVYKGERNRPTDAIKQLKRTYWKRFSVEMEHDRYGGEKKIWNMLLKRKKPVIEEVLECILTQNHDLFFHKLDCKVKANLNVSCNTGLDSVETRSIVNVLCFAINRQRKLGHKRNITSDDSDQTTFDVARLLRGILKCDTFTKSLKEATYFLNLLNDNPKDLDQAIELASLLGHQLGKCWYSQFLTDQQLLIEKGLYSRCEPKMIKQIYNTGQSYMKYLKLLCEITLSVVKNYLFSQENVYVQIGAFYLLYAFFYKQPIRKDVTIRLTLEEHRSLKRLLNKMLDQGQYDALLVTLMLNASISLKYVRRKLDPLAPIS